MKRFVHFLLLIFGVIFGLQAQSPVASYTFSGNAKDGSAFKNHASVNGANLTSDRFGWANSAFNFDGIQASLSAKNTAQINSPKVTVSFWVNPTEFPVVGEVYLLSHGGYQERWKISLPDHGKPVFTTHSNGACCSDLDSGIPLTIGSWTHVVMVHDGAKDIIYFNGAKVNEKNAAGDLDETTYELGIGFDPINNNYSFNGALDDVELYDVALNDAQISALYNIQSIAPSVGEGKVASYSFNGSGLDDTDFKNHANVNTAKITTDRFGYGNSALLCDSSTVTASGGTHLNSDYITIEFWVKPNSFPASGERYIMSNGGWQERWKISMPDHGRPVFTTHSNGACCSDLDAGTPLTIGKWTHVVMVHDGVNDIIYFNGVKVKEKSAAGELDPTAEPLGIGFDPIDNNYFFDGAIDDIEIYNVALSAVDIAALFTTGSTFPGTVSDLVAQYNLNGNGKDDTQFGNDATLGDSANSVANRHGWASNALSGYATADNSVALQSDFITIGFWVNPNSFPASGERYIMSNGGWQERWKISIPDHGKPVFTTHSNGACCSDLDSGTPLTIGSWTYVTMVHDGAKDIIYFNGVKVNEKNATGTLDKTKYPLGIGYDPIDNNYFFDGSMDDVQIYSRALSAAEIAALYDAQKTAVVVAGNLVADYRANGNANDATAFSNHASVQGAQLTKDRFGKSNQAYSFNGINQSLVAANSPQQNSSFNTISFWINPKSFVASGEDYILSNGGWKERWKISLPDHGRPVFTTHSNGACCSDLDAGSQLTIGVWTHLAMVHDGSKDIIYLNGAKVNEKNAPGALDETVYPLGIGFDPIDNNYFFDGALDEVQIYNVALSDVEIAALYAVQSLAPANTDTEAPCAPLSLSAEVEFTNVLLSWLPAVDNVGVSAYNVYQDGISVATVQSTSDYIAGLAPLTEFVFGVSAVDAAGNESLITTLKVTSGQDETPDTTPPTKPGNLRGNAGSNSVLLAWDESTDDRKLSGYVVSLDGLFFDSLAETATSVFIGGLDTETAYTFEVYAYDLAGNNSEIAELTLSTTKPLDTGEAGLVAHYPFDGNANDATPYNNHGVIGGNPVFETATHPLGAGKQNIKFDGDKDSVFVANAVQLISDYTTVSFWIRVDNVNTADGEAYVIDFGHWSERWKISLPQHLKIVWTTHGYNVQFPDGRPYDMDSGDGNEMVKGFWWYVTMVHDGEKDLIYVNGDLVNMKPVPTKLNSTNRPLCFGSNNVDGGQYFPGALDNVKIYNKALSAAEIAKLFSSGTTGIKDFAIAKYGDVRLTPNPVSNQLVIDHSFNAKNDVRIRILDNVGRQYDGFVPSKGDIQSGKITFDTNKLPSGLYFVNFIVDGQNIGSVKFSKI
ncbi:MAG: T9SS type A sorting domain-containing protein [Saprospiraceae bacterium]|nr:T9SS type A sorting domain-containing protein [Saprospiraceae bacterium]